MSGRAPGGRGRGFSGGRGGGRGDGRGFGRGRGGRGFVEEGPPAEIVGKLPPHAFPDHLE